MRWFIVLIIVVLAVAAIGVVRRRRSATSALDAQRLGELKASTEARRRLDTHRNPTDGSAGSGSGGVGGWA